MILRFRVPTRIWLEAGSEAGLSPKAHFVHEGLACEMALVGDTPFCSEQSPESCKYVRPNCALEIIIHEDARNDRLAVMVQKTDWGSLAAFLRSIANRCIRTIRNYGYVPFLRELRDDGYPLYALLWWNVEISEDGVTWERLPPEPDDFARYLAYLQSRNSTTPTLLATLWPDIEEAIQDDLTATPDKEFAANALEHLAQGNHRMALLESVIGLEITLDGFLKEHIRLRTGASDTKVNEFLNPTLGLTSRLFLLYLIFAQEELRRLDLDKVRQAVRWRNDVVHREGRLPEDASESNVRAAVSEVITLASFLAYKTQQTKASPEEAALAEYIRDKYPSYYPSVRLLPHHMVSIELHHMDLAFTQDSTNWNSLGSIISDLEQQLKQRDRRFNLDEHLHVAFYSFPWRLEAIWSGGEFRRVGGNWPD